MINVVGKRNVGECVVNTTRYGIEQNNVLRNYSVRYCKLISESDTRTRKGSREDEYMNTDLFEVGDRVKRFVSKTKTDEYVITCYESWMVYTIRKIQFGWALVEPDKGKIVYCSLKELEKGN